MKSLYWKNLMIGAGLLFALNVQAGSLHEAVYNNDIELIKIRLENGADINQLGLGWYEGTALHLAVRDDQQEIAVLLLERGAAVDVRDHNDYTPLHNAAWNGNLAMVKLLFDAGADIMARTYSGRTPLSCAYRSKKVEVIEFIEGKLQTTSN